jgi:hypothetical protein
MNTHNNVPKTNDITGNSLLKQQLKEAMSLIRMLQRSNAELIKQNAGLIQINSRLTQNFDHPIDQNEDDIFLNQVLSIIKQKDKEPIQLPNTPNDNTNAPGENPRSLNDNTRFLSDNTNKANDNTHPANDKDNSPVDNASQVNEKPDPANENPGKPADNPHSVIDNTKEVADNGILYIEINGKKEKKEKVLNMLRYRINILMDRNFSDDELIEIYKDQLKQHEERVMEHNKTKHEDKLKKVPALYQLENNNTAGRYHVNNEFSVLLRRYALFKKRGKQRDGSLIKQVKMLLLLFKYEQISPASLFAKTGVSAVTGNRYVARLKELDFLQTQGSKNFHYQITEEAISFLENSGQ